NPSFASEEIEPLRGEILTRLRERDNNTRSVAERRFLEALFPQGHPYRRDPAGSPESIAAMSREDITGFYESAYGPAGMILAIAGDLSFDRARQAVSRVFGSWRGGPGRGAPAIPPGARPRGIVRTATPMPGKTQTDIVLGVPAVSRKAEDYYPLDFANLVLGRLGLMGRLGKNVRDEKGMAYYAYSGLSAWLWDGFWAAYAGINPANTERAVASIAEEIERIVREPITEEELEDGIRNQIGSVPLKLETNEGLASLLHDIEYYNLGADYLDKRRDILTGMTPEAVLSAARRYLDPANYVLSVAGP
ncbi:MAG: insulinase family protein, partial [Armatimonadetes bacterium]|nr:insulinase family protein [Armatimonadota bacterium]